MIGAELAKGDLDFFGAVEAALDAVVFHALASLVHRHQDVVDAFDAHTWVDFERASAFN